MNGIRQICDEYDIVMILDEVQCGMGRTGTIMTYFQYGILPDVVCLAKGIGAGFPIGAFVANKKVGDALKPGDHGSTYGGNPMAGCACKTVFKIIDEQKMLKHDILITLDPAVIKTKPLSNAFWIYGLTGWVNSKPIINPNPRRSFIQSYFSTISSNLSIRYSLKKKYVDELDWIKEKEMLDLIAIAQSAPGAIAINGAIVIGFKLAKSLI
mgnify:CR=1 FL=1